MLRMIDRAAEALAIIAFSVSSAFVCLNVLNRYLVLGLFRDLAKDFESLRPAYFAVRDLLSNVVVTADEVPGLLLVWVAFLGAYLAMRREGHIAFDMVLAVTSCHMQAWSAAGSTAGHSHSHHTTSLT